MPLIALTACPKIEDYRQAIQHAGGDIRIVDHTMRVEDALDGVNGLLLTGGDEPSGAGHPADDAGATTADAAERDQFEAALVHEARRRTMPILGICRGAQVITRALGGTIVDVPDAVPGALEHDLASPPHQPFEHAHEIWVEEDSLLARLMREKLVGGDTCSVNSRHRQAIKESGGHLRIVATAPDGIVEAVEDPARPYCLGVQWHPENFWRTGEFRPIFEGFIEAAGGG
ncbi:MAG: gamma-glutamyl-gamma-aminobutyrate hydrolase family protein [Vicinamibacterales bacterium]